MARMLKAMAAIGLTLAPAASAAWSPQAHRAIGAIAYDDLQRSDPALAAS